MMNTQRIVICGSMSSYSVMQKYANILNDAGILSILPEIDDPFIQTMNQDTFDKYKRQVSLRHIRKIRDNKKTFGILVINLDKHGIHDYIGPNSFAEIAVALAHYKKIYLLQGIPQFYHEELLAWDVVPLNGNLNRLISDYKQFETEDSIQLTLFDKQDKNE